MGEDKRAASLVSRVLLFNYFIASSYNKKEETE